MVRSWGTFVAGAHVNTLRWEIFDLAARVTTRADDNNVCAHTRNDRHPGIPRPRDANDLPAIFRPPCHEIPRTLLEAPQGAGFRNRKSSVCHRNPRTRPVSPGALELKISGKREEGAEWGATPNRGASASISVKSPRLFFCARSQEANEIPPNKIESRRNAGKWFIFWSGLSEGG